MSKVIQYLMREFEDYDEEREFFAEIKPLAFKWPEKPTIERILNQVEAI